MGSPSMESTTAMQLVDSEDTEPTDQRTRSSMDLGIQGGGGEVLEPIPLGHAGMPV